jgi:hypothetical protein
MGAQGNVINKLMMFERKIMRKIYGPTRTDDGDWRIKTNQEINDILGLLKTKINLAETRRTHD